jgi:creatinine amidohydrolase/Fe(II)-dependent formamide hydrolase-like protein
VPFKSSSQVDFEGVPVFVYLDFDEVTANGVMGDPRVSSPEIGKKILDHVVEIGAHFVQKFAQIPTRIGGNGPRTVPR